MAAFSNTMQHMVDTLNIVCGRYRRAGQKIVADMINTPYPVHAEVIPPQRNYAKAPPSRIRGAGMLGFDRMAATLAEEILTPGEGQIRALLVNGSNPASCLPDQKKAVEAFKSLDLLVTVDPYMTNTAQLSHYVLPPMMMYERHDLPISDPNFNIGTTTWAAHAPPVIDVPGGFRSGAGLVSVVGPGQAAGAGDAVLRAGARFHRQPPAIDRGHAARCAAPRAGSATTS